MWGPFAGVPGQLKTVLSRLPSNAATLLANLDAEISTRAAAATALSTATWTNAKAAFLDAEISTRATQASVNSIASSVSALPVGVVKSVKRGTWTGAASASAQNITFGGTIDPLKSQVKIWAPLMSGMGDGTAESYWIRPAALSATQLSLIAYRFFGSVQPATVSYEIVEFY